MCRAEVTMTTYDWDPKKIYPQPHLAYEHECVNFEALDDWAKSRSFDITDPKYFVHPTLGEFLSHAHPSQGTSGDTDDGRRCRSSFPGRIDWEVAEKGYQEDIRWAASKCRLEYRDV